MEPRDRSQSFVVRISSPASRGRWRGYVEEIGTRVYVSFLTFDELVAFLVRRTGHPNQAQSRSEAARRWLRRWYARAFARLAGRGRS